MQKKKETRKNGDAAGSASVPVRQKKRKEKKKMSKKGSNGVPLKLQAVSFDRTEVVDWVLLGFTGFLEV